MYLPPLSVPNACDVGREYNNLSAISGEFRIRWKYILLFINICSFYD